MIIGGMEVSSLIVDSIVNWFFQTILRRYLAMLLKVVKDFIGEFRLPEKLNEARRQCFRGIVGMLAEA